VVVLVLGGLLVIRLANPSSLPPVIILPPTPLAVKSGRIPDRWIPANWTWLQKACLSVLGPPRQVRLDVVVSTVDGTLDSIIAHDALGQPLSTGGNAAVWIVPALQPVQRVETIQSSLGMITGNHMEGKVIVGNFTAELFPQLRNNATDLLTCLVFPSEGQSNVVAAMRVQIPYDKALFVIDSRQPELATNRTAIWIKADEVDAKGNIVQHPQPSH
jgi:hypothetical protein